MTLLFAVTITGILANTIVSPAIPDILDAFDVGAGGAGLFVAAASLPGIVLAPAVGILADRFGRREVLVPCLVVFALSGGLASAAPSFPVLLALRFLQGCGGAGLINLAVVLIGDHWDGIDRARMIGRNAAVLTLSLAVLPMAGGALTDTFGWRASFAPYWIGLFTAVAVTRTLPPSVRRDAGLREQLAEARPVLRSRAVLGVLATGFVMFLLIFGLFLTVLPVHLEEEFGIGAGRRGLIIGLPAVTSTMAALALGRLRARTGWRNLAAVSSALFVVAFAVMALAGDLPALVVGTLLYGLAEGVMIPTLQDRTAGLAPATSRGAVMAVWVGAARAGQTVGPLAAGVAVAGVGGRATFGLGSLLAAVLLAAQLAAWRRREESVGVVAGDAG